MNGAQIGMIQITMIFLQTEIPMVPSVVSAVWQGEDHGGT